MRSTPPAAAETAVVRQDAPAQSPSPSICDGSPLNVCAGCVRCVLCWGCTCGRPVYTDEEIKFWTDRAAREPKVLANYNPEDAIAGYDSYALRLTT